MLRIVFHLLAPKKKVLIRRIKKTRSKSLDLEAPARPSQQREQKNALIRTNEESTSTHVDPQTNLPRMVDIMQKKPSYRLATAVSTIVVPPSANSLLEGMKQILTPAISRAPDDSKNGASSQMEEYYTTKKGPLFATAVIAGTNAVKQTSTLIPFCHPVPIQKCSFTFRRRVVSNTVSSSSLPHRVVLRKRSSIPSASHGNENEFSILYCFCTVATGENKTGVEMEALTGATVAAVTLYDMLKGIHSAQEDGLSLGEAFILAKRGGKSDFTKLLVSEPNAAPKRQSSEGYRPLPASTSEDASEKNAEDDNHANDDENEEAVEEEEEDAEHPADGDARKGTRTAKNDAGSEMLKADRNQGKSQAERLLAKHKDRLEDENSSTKAWWHSTKQEKKMHEMFPRRKYLPNSRISDDNLPKKNAQTTQEKNIKPENSPSSSLEKKLRKSSQTSSSTRGYNPNQNAAEAEDGENIEEEEEVEEVEVDEEEVEEIVKATKASAKNINRKKSHSHADRFQQKEEEEDDESNDEDEAEADAEDEELEQAQRKSPTKKGNANQKNRKARVQEEEDDDESNDEDEAEADAEDEELEQAQRKSPTKKGNANQKNRKARVQEEEDDESNDEDEAEADAEDEELEQAQRKSPTKKGNANQKNRKARVQEEVDEDESNDEDNDDETRKAVAGSRSRAHSRGRLTKESKNSSKKLKKVKKEPVVEIEDDEDEVDNDGEDEVESKSPSAKRAKKIPPSRSPERLVSSTSSKRRQVNYAEEEEDTVVHRPKKNASNTFRPVKHDTWDNPTFLYSDDEVEEEAAPPASKTKKSAKKKSSSRR